MTVQKQIELDNQQPSPDEGKVHRLFLTEVQNQIDNLVLETAATKENYTIYGMKDSTGLRYIGITKKNIQKRFKEHLSSAKYYKKTTHRDWWVMKCLSNNIPFNIFEIYRYNIDRETAEKIEKIIINKFFDLGFKLTNATWNGFKASKALKDKKHQEVGVVLLNLDGTFYKEFNSLKSCALYLKCHPSLVTNVLKKKKKSVRGCLCFYKHEYNPEFQYEYVKYKHTNSPMKQDITSQARINQKKASRKSTCTPVKRISFERRRKDL